MTEPGHDASTCASGSQTDNGNIGTFPITAITIAKVTTHEVTRGPPDAGTVALFDVKTVEM
jgi:hypothetical protein